MNIHTHHKLILSLVSEIRRLRQELEKATAMAEDYSESAYRAKLQAGKAHQEARYQAEEVRRAIDDASYRNWEQEKALKELVRAREYGDDWAEERALRKLKSL